MSARDVIWGAISHPKVTAGTAHLSENQYAWQTRAVLSALAAAGYRILGPDELDPMTVERCADVIDTDGKVNGIDRDRLAQAIRSLPPEAPHGE